MLAPAAISCGTNMLRPGVSDRFVRYTWNPFYPVGNSFPLPLYLFLAIPSQLPPPQVNPNSPPGLF